MIVSRARPVAARRAPRRHRGYAIAILLVLVTIGGLSALVQQLNSASANGLFRDTSVLEQIRIAKAALIDYSANHPDRPGGLPCPDRNGDGLAEISCATEAEQIGRLPWVTLRLPQPAIDSALWYALSPAFQIQGREADFAWAVNSATQGQLELREAASNVTRASRLVAVIIYPGPALAGQARPAANWATAGTIGEYLESANANTADGFRFAAGDSGPAFNDIAAGVTHDELFNVVEAVVEDRLRSTVLRAIMDSHQGTLSTASIAEKDARATVSFGKYPFVAPFTDPFAPSTVYLGDIGPRYAGLLPVDATQPLAYVVGGTSSCSGLGCTNSCLPVPTPPPAPVDTFDCELYNPSGATGAFEIRVDIGGGARTFLQPFRVDLANPALSDLTGWDSTLMSGPGQALGTPPVRKHEVLSDGSAVLRVQFDMLVTPAPSIKPKLRIRAPRHNPGLTFPTTVAFGTSPTAWFVRNEWHRHIYYVTNREALPGSTSDCVIGGISPTWCLSVVYNNLSGTPTLANNADLVLILMGRPVRVSGVLQDRTLASTDPRYLEQYLEGDNLQPPQYEHRVFRNEFNDRAVYIRRP